MDYRKYTKHIYNHIKESHFLKSVLTLSSGVVVAQIINFFCTPIIGRLYSPNEIGDYTVITANATVISAFVCLGMMTALIIPEKDEESRGLCKLVSIATLLLTTLTILILLIGASHFRIFNLEDVSYNCGLFILWLYVIVNTIYNICYAYANRLKLYKVMFWNPVIGASVNMSISIILGLLEFGFAGYVIANIASLVLNIIHLLIHANPYISDNMKVKDYMELTNLYRRFPLFQMPANLIANIGVQMPIWTIKAAYGASSLGMYSMTMRILGLPSTLLATPINRVYFQEASQRYNKGEDIGEFSFRILETNIKIAIIPIIILIVLGQQVFSIFLGKQWAEAGLYASILGIYQLVLFCSSCLSGYFVIIKKNSWNLIYSVGTLAIQGILYYVFVEVISADIYTFFMVFSIIMISIHVAAHTFFFKYVGFNIKKYYIFVLKYIGLPLVITYFVFYLMMY